MPTPPPNFGHSFFHLLRMGLTEDILPVVCDRSLQISPNSQLSSVGKVPSIITPAGFVSGISAWTQKRATEAEVTKWAREPRFGVALQTRTVRGLDIDVDDREAAVEVATAFENAIGICLPRRGRANSGRVLLAFRCFVPVKKRSFRVDDGLVELLGDGQQFVFHSIHESGDSYEWEGGLPEDFPEISHDQLEAAWQAIAVQFSSHPAPKAPALNQPVAADPRLEWLGANWPNDGFGPSGFLNIECPFKAFHSSDSGSSECSYLAAGTNGYSEGRYHCFHASCASRTQEEFDQATGFHGTFWGSDGLSQWPSSIRLNGDGSVPATLANLTIALELEELIGGKLAFDSFVDDVFLTSTDGSPSRLFNDDIRAETRLRLEKAGFRRINRDDLREAVGIVGRSNGIDSAQDWLNGLEWDGRTRIKNFLTEYFGSEPSDYAAAISQYLWTALAARILQPGCQADMVPILVSPEGRHKSTALQAIPPTPEQFVEVDLHHRDADLSRIMRGKLIGEIAELRGLQQRQVEGIKAFVTRRWEEWTPKYIEKPVRYERRLGFVGTTNDEEFLGRGTGERRWLPIKVGDAAPKRIAADRDQLWAEAAAIVRARLEQGLDPVMWERAYELGFENREQFQLEDIYESRIAEWLSSDEGQRIAIEGFTTEFAFLNIICVPHRTAPIEQSRLAHALRSSGFHQERLRKGRHRLRIWKLPASEK